jgi:hypothetical protein
MPFLLMVAPNGKRMLVNEDVTFTYIEEDDGTASAVNIAGIKAATGESFENLINAKMTELDDGQ